MTLLAVWSHVAADSRTPVMIVRLAGYSGKSFQLSGIVRR